MSQWPTSAGVLGKVPWRNEYLQASGLPSELRLLDAWVLQNAHASLALAEAVAGGAKEPASYGFLMKLTDKGDPLRAVAGVVGPSHDRAGRAYPLAVAAPITLAKDVDLHPEIVPVILESYWQAAVDVLSAVRAAPLDANDRSLQRLTEEPLESGASALDLYAAWARQTAAGELCALLERSFAWLASTAARIVDLVASKRSLPIRVPLGSSAGGALCFWLDLLRRVAFARGHVPSFFWSHDGNAGDALLCLDTPGETTLAVLWRLETSSGAVCDFTLSDPSPERAWSGAAAEGSLDSFLALVEARSVAS